MKGALALALLVALGGCEVARETTRTRIVSTLTPEQTQACTEAAVRARPGLTAASVSGGSAVATTGGPVLTLNFGAERAVCTFDSLGRLQSVAFG